MRYILGIDNGLTMTKAVLFDVNGKKIGISQIKTPVSGTQIDMENLWEATVGCIRSIIGNTGINPLDIAAVAGSGHGNGLYCIGKDGLPVMPAHSSMTEDPRPIIDEWKRTGAAKEAFEYTLQNLWAGQPPAILAWLKENRLSGGIYKAMFCKDWIKYKLTGRVTTDYTDAGAGSLLDCTNKSYSTKLMRIFGLEDEYSLLPELCDSFAAAGYVTDEAAAQTGLREGIPVASGLFDVNACLLGSGVARDDRYGIISGTWGVNACVTKEPVKNEDILQCCCFADQKQYLCIESAPTSSVNLEWFMTNILKNRNFSEADRMAEKFGAGDCDILYLPFIHPSMRYTALSAGFYGLHAYHDETHLLRAVFEGVCFGHRMQIEQLQKAGLTRDKAVLSGGAANSGVWAQMFADVLGMQIETAAETQAGALGAAVCGAVAAGIYDDVDSAVTYMVKPGAYFAPNSENTKIYMKKYEKFKKLIELCKEL